jgi:hypothetical protein
MYRYIRNNLISFDRLLNTFVGGDAELTFCGECWIRKRVLLVFILDFVFGKNHCKDSFYWDISAGDIVTENRRKGKYHKKDNKCQ